MDDLDLAVVLLAGGGLVFAGVVIVGILEIVQLLRRIVVLLEHDDARLEASSLPTVSQVRTAARRFGMTMPDARLDRDDDPPERS